MVSTHLKNISQTGSFPQEVVKIKTCLKPPPRLRFWLLLRCLQFFVVLCAQFRCSTPNALLDNWRRRGPLSPHCTWCVSNQQNVGLLGDIFFKRSLHFTMWDFHRLFFYSEVVFDTCSCSCEMFFQNLSELSPWPFIIVSLPELIIS